MITFEREHFNTGEPITIRVTHNKEVHEVKVQYLTDVVFEPGVYGKQDNQCRDQDEDGEGGGRWNTRRGRGETLQI